MTDKKATAPAKPAAKGMTDSEKLTAVIAVLKANGMSLPKGLHDDEAAD